MLDICQLTSRCESGAVLPLLYLASAISQDSQPALWQLIKVVSIADFCSRARGRGRCSFAHAKMRGTALQGSAMDICL